MNPTLSIIVPVYNIEPYLKQCIDSILNQPYSDFELILVDDGSTDNSGKICDDYAKKDDRIFVLHKSNGGLSSAKNAGLNIANGKYLSFIDGDDFISEDFYLKNIDFLQAHPETDILILQYCDYDGTQNKIFKNTPLKLTDSNKIINYMLSMNYIGSSWINIYRSHVFNKLRFKEGIIYEDGFLLIDIVEKVKNVYISNTGIYYYRKRKESIMSKKKTLKNWYDILNTHIKQLDYCYNFPDNNKLFLGKYRVCYRALLYASLNYSDSFFNEYIKIFQSYNYSFAQLIKVNFTTTEIIKLFFLKIIGFKSSIRIYKIVNYLKEFIKFPNKHRRFKIQNYVKSIF